MSDEVIVTVDDLREARRRSGRHCILGVEAWATRHGLDFQHFVKHGYPESKIRVDALGSEVADIARERFEVWQRSQRPQRQ